MFQRQPPILWAYNFFVTLFSTTKQRLGGEKVVNISENGIKHIFEYKA